MKKNTFHKSMVLALGLSAFAMLATAQTVTNPCPNRVISWNFDYNSTINPADLAGLAPATNWVDSWLNNVRVNLPDNTGAATTMGIPVYQSSGQYGNSIQGHPGYDANGTANKEMLNGYMNAGPAGWGPPFTNSTFTITNVPYPVYDIVVYFSSDASGRHTAIDDGITTNYASTMGSSEISGANALFVPSTSTNNASFPGADFVFFTGLTNSNLTVNELPKSGLDAWLGIASFQVIQASNVYVLYGPSPASQVVPIGQPASFSVLAGGLNPRYQWQHAGTNLLNATNATYSIATTALGQDGNYSVIVTNSFSSMTSVVATLTFYTPRIVEWDGNGSTWDTTSLFWTMNGGASTTNYTETDNVRFGPLGSAQSTVALGGSTLTPSSITVSNASYTFASGSLAGTGSLRVRNNGTVVLDLPDLRSGPTLIDAGSTLQLDAGDTAGSLGSGALTNNGTLLFKAGGDEAYGYPVYGTGNVTNNSSSGTITLGNDIKANYLVQTGGGNLLLQGSNTLSGGLIVSNGSVWARSLGALGNAPVSLFGGELQLAYNFDFAAPSVTLAGGLLHGGVGGSCIFEGQVILATDSSIQVDGGLTLANSAGVNGGTFNLTKTGGGTLTLNGNSNSWNSLTLIGGTVAFNSAANLSVTSSIAGIGNLSQTGTGTTTLSGDNSSMLGNLSISAGTLLVNTTSSTAAATITGGTLGGNGSIAGPVSVLPGGTLAPGTASIGTLTLNSDLTIGGNVAVKVNKSLAQSNDVVSVSGTLSNTNNGTLTVNNLGPALSVGNKFTLFSQAVTGGASLAVTGGGVTWSNNLANDGSIIVLSTMASYSTNISYSISGSTLTVSWPATHLGWILQSQTNSLTTGLGTNWTDVTGTSSVNSTNITISATVPTAFYRLRHP